jgi:hypothetical protein
VLGLGDLGIGRQLGADGGGEGGRVHGAEATTAAAHGTIGNWS